MGRLLDRGREILRGDQGVSIVFACLVLAVFMVMGSVVVAYGYSNYSRSTANTVRSQGFETVSNGVSLIWDQVDGKQVVVTGGSYSNNGLAASKTAPSWLVALLKTPGNGAVVSMTSPANTIGDVRVSCTRVGDDAKSASFDIVCEMDGTDDGIKLGFTARLVNAAPGEDANKDGKPDSYTVTLSAQDIGKVRG